VKISFSKELDSKAVASEAVRWEADDLMVRLWDKDPTVWFDPPVAEIADRLGWLDLPVTAMRHLDDLDNLATSAISEGISHVVLCGMGGSSLAPDVYSHSLPQAPGYPDLIVLDSTHPDAVLAVDERINPATTWFIISSKSGGTLETLSFFRYFWNRVEAVSASPGAHFIAVTDPGSTLESLAIERGFRAVFLADPTVGGRYSALTAFGLVPAALIGADVRELLHAGHAASALCNPETPIGANPAFVIGASIAAAANDGRDKTRFVGTGSGERFGVWVEQLIAESTGKDGQGIVPIDGGPDRPAAHDELVIAVGDEPRDTPIQIEFERPSDIAGAMFIMELATAVAGAILRIHPFNQPDVQRAKELAKAAMAGDLPATEDPTPIRSPNLSDETDRLLASEPASYIAVQAYVAPSSAIDARLATLRETLASAHGTATTVGYGPRFLHSTGQLHKGGPSGGLYIQLVDTPHEQLPVPGTNYSFNELISAQASGDRAALLDVGRDLVSIDLGPDPEASLIGLNNLLRGSVA
jgi:transaldolase/glucose-6-phosphate isomerase